jgi:hypothetical protein
MSRLGLGGGEGGADHIVLHVLSEPGQPGPVQVTRAWRACCPAAGEFAGRPGSVLQAVNARSEEYQ